MVARSWRSRSVGRMFSGLMSRVTWASIFLVLVALVDGTRGKAVAHVIYQITGKHHVGLMSKTWVGPGYLASRGVIPQDITAVAAAARFRYLSSTGRKRGGD